MVSIEDGKLRPGTLYGQVGMGLSDGKEEPLAEAVGGGKTTGGIIIRWDWIVNDRKTRDDPEAHMLFLFACSVPPDPLAFSAIPSALLCKTCVVSS
jgi:hypothetical protein